VFQEVTDQRNEAAMQKDLLHGRRIRCCSHSFPVGVRVKRGDASMCQSLAVSSLVV
jgi:hypothetical protein